MADSAAVAIIDVVTLFGNLKTMYLLFSKSQKALAVFEDIQRSEGLPLRSLKRLNTVRWVFKGTLLKNLSGTCIGSLKLAGFRQDRMQPDCCHLFRPSSF